MHHVQLTSILPTNDNTIGISYSDCYFVHNEIILLISESKNTAADFALT